MPHLDDQKLVARVLAGDEQAFEQLFDDLFPRLFRFVLTRVDGDADRAEDIVQQVLCRAMTKLESFRGDASLFTWLCTFCRNETHRLARVEKWDRVEPMTRVLPDAENAAELLSSPTLGPDETAVRSEVIELVHRILDDLPTHYGRSLEWKYCQGLSVNEIAQRLQMSPKAAESTLTRARSAFRDKYAALQPRLPASEPNS